MPKDYFSLGERSKETEELRKKVKEGLEDKVVAFFREKRGQVAIYDANVSFGTSLWERKRKEDADLAALERG